MKLTRWGHGHTFITGAGVALAVVHWWLLALFLLAAVTCGVLLGVVAARGAWSLSGRVARWVQAGRVPAYPSFPEVPPGSEIQVIARPRPSRYDRPRI